MSRTLPMPELPEFGAPPRPDLHVPSVLEPVPSGP